MVKLLFLAANPENTSPLRLSEEMREIQSRLRASENRQDLELVQEWAVQLDDLQEHLLRHRPQIVHFSGHGSRAGQIILEDRFGCSQPVRPEALERLFKTLRDNIRCVVLNLCYSEVQAEAIARVIDCVVGMSAEIQNDSAIAFARSFYQGLLGFGRDVRTAFDLGCGQLDLKNLSDSDIPKLLTRKGVDPALVSFGGTNPNP
jgi:hypothetical protein